MPYKETPIEKKYYTIGEVATLLNIPPSLIRFWEEKFIALNPKKSAKGTRKYTRVDIDLLKLINHLVKECGYTIKGANTVLKNNKCLSANQLVLIDRLKHIKAFLIKLKDKI